ncbi:MAG: GNAT family N-acetyltransferase [bacterium]
MEISILTSRELTAKQWESYTQSFNFVFNKNFAPENFTHKYLNTCDQTSYHALLVEKDEVVGGCSVIPYHYLFEAEKNKIGLAVDVFILPSYRSDPYTLLRMYQSLKSRLKEENIAMVIAVPNDLVYPYWKNIVKWKDIGAIPYFAYPVNLANVLKSGCKILNVLSRAFATLNFGLNTLISFLFNSVQKPFPISVDRADPVIEEQRYTADHVIIKNDRHAFAYRIVEENQVQTAYLIDFYNQKNHLKDLKTLLFAIRHVLKHHQIDLLIFVGKLHFFQSLLIKIPYKKEPKHLYLMGDIFNPADIINNFDVFDYKNWDFGLFNYDVR